MMVEPRQHNTAQSFRGELKHHEPMARYTSWRVGGPAEQMFRPVDIDDLAAFLRQLDADTEILWMGLGSNLLVRDGGIRGVVIMTSGLLNTIEQMNNGCVRVEAGVACAKVARYCTRLGLVGAEFLVGIPGTMGGALAMNAGAFGGETWPLVTAVETLDRHGQRHLRYPQEYQVSYRHVAGPPDEWFIAAHLSLTSGDVEASQARVKALLAQRNEKQPIGVPSSGSVFRNPPNDYAGRLIESCGLKGFCIGGACVSVKHANFIINTDSATAHDIEQLIGHIIAVVKQQQGVTLIPEVHIVGQADD